MVIWKKSSLALGKIFYKLIGQQSFFGGGNLYFTTVYLPCLQQYDNLCNKFRLKTLVRNFHPFLPAIIVNNI